VRCPVNCVLLMHLPHGIVPQLTYSTSHRNVLSAVSSRQELHLNGIISKIHYAFCHLFRIWQHPHVFVSLSCGDALAALRSNICGTGRVPCHLVSLRVVLINPVMIVSARLTIPLHPYTGRHHITTPSFFFSNIYFRS